MKQIPGPEIWSYWLWKIDQKTIWKVLDVSPHKEEEEAAWKDITDPRDWVTAIGGNGAWRGPVSLWNEVCTPIQIEPKDKYQNRPEIVLLKKSPKVKKKIPKKKKNKGDADSDKK